ncbi:MAG: 4Fe-4S binding protein [Planctomycetes bacterium]|nr:4Fe-4S binding protein [Planctomycetota bacterium]
MSPAPAVPPTPARDVHASLPRVDRHKPKCGPARPSNVSRRRAYVLIGVHVLIGLHFLHWAVTGKSVSPVEPSEAMQTVELGRINAGFLLFTALIAGTLVFGRWFCGWACHIVALQDLCAWLLGRIGLKPRPVRSRLLVLAPWLVAGQMFAWPIVQHWLFPAEKTLPRVADWQLEVMSTDLWATFPKWIMAPMSVLVVGFLIVWWLGAKGFCTHGCPYGAFFAVADRFSPMRIKVTPSCDACGHCTTVCTSNVRVHEEVAKHGRIVDPGCMKCLDCVSVCPKEALHYGIGKPAFFATSQQRVQARSDFTWPEEIAVALVAFVATQWTFRGAWFGEGVPFLLSVATGVITAVFVLLVWRLVRRRDVTFQHTVLKEGGRLTHTGRWGGALLVGWLLFTAHTFVAQRLKDAAIAEFRALAAPGASAVAPAALQSVLATTERAHAWDLVDDPVVGEMRALLLRRLGRHADAEAAFLAVLDARGGFSYAESDLILASYFMDPARRRYDEAERLIDAVLARMPDHSQAREMKKFLVQRRK